MFFGILGKKILRKNAEKWLCYAVFPIRTPKIFGPRVECDDYIRKGQKWAFFLFKIPPVAPLFDVASSIFALCTLPPKVCIVVHSRRPFRLRRSIGVDSTVYIRYTQFVVSTTFTIHSHIFQPLPLLPVYGIVSSIYQCFQCLPVAPRFAQFYALLTRFYRAIALFICSLFIALASIVHAPWCTAYPVPLSWGCVYTVYIVYIQFLPI